MCLYDLFGRVVHVYMGIRCSASTGLLYGGLWTWGDDCVLGLGWGQGTPISPPKRMGPGRAGSIRGAPPLST